LGTSDLLALISAIAAILAALFAAFAWSVSKKTLVHQTLLDLQKEYRSPQMLFAVEKLRDFYREYGPEKFVDKYEEIRREEQNWVLKLDKNQQIEAVQNTLHNQRRLVSHFYQQLATLYINRVLPKDIVYKSWSEADLRIIPEVLIPIENRLREVLHNPPLEPLNENSPLLILYKDSIKIPIS